MQALLGGFFFFALAYHKTIDDNKSHILQDWEIWECKTLFFNKKYNDKCLRVLRYCLVLLIKEMLKNCNTDVVIYLKRNHKLFRGIYKSNDYALG